MFGSREISMSEKHLIQIACKYHKTLSIHSEKMMPLNNSQMKFSCHYRVPVEAVPKMIARNPFKTTFRPRDGINCEKSITIC